MKFELVAPCGFEKNRSNQRGEHCALCASIPPGQWFCDDKDRSMDTLLMYIEESLNRDDLSPNILERALGAPFFSDETKNDLKAVALRHLLKNGE